MFLFGRNGVCVCVCMMRVESAAASAEGEKMDGWMDVLGGTVSNVRRSHLLRSTSPTTKPVSFPRPRALCVL